MRLPIPGMRFVLACVATLGLSAVAAAAEYPAKPIRLICPYVAGGITDQLSRDYAKALSDVLHQLVVVENKVGAGGNIGVDVVSKAAPDGYTIAVGAIGPLAINVSLLSKMPYDVQKDLTPISRLAFSASVLAVNPSLGVKSVKELIALAKANPGKYSYASGGTGTTQHLGGEMFTSMAGVKIAHVPYKGENAAAMDVLGGHVPMIFSHPPSVLPHIKAGKLIPLAVTSKVRSPLLPDVPTLDEEGLTGYEITAWFGIVAPAGLPKDVEQKLHAATVKAMASPEVAAFLAANGAIAATDTPEEFAAFIRSETSRYAALIKQTGAKGE